MYVYSLLALQHHYVVGRNVLGVTSMKERMDCDSHRIPIIPRVNNGGYLFTAATTIVYLPVPGVHF